MKLTKANFYQAIELPFPGKRVNINCVDKDTCPGVSIDLTDHIVRLSHKEWDFDVLVPTANLRSALVEVIVEKIPCPPSIMTEEEMIIQKPVAKKKKKDV